MKVQTIDTPRGERWFLIDSECVPVAEVNAYLGNLDALRKSPKTIRTYAYALLVYCRYLEERGLKVTDLGTSLSTMPVVLLADFMTNTQFPGSSEGGATSIESRLPRVSDERMNNIMTAVMGLYRYLARAGVMGDAVEDLYSESTYGASFQTFLSELTGRRNSVHNALMIRTKKKAPKYVTRETYNELFRACRTLRDKLLVALLYECGLRIGEALGVHLSDLDQVESGALRIVPRENNENGARVKYRAAGEVYLPDYVVRLLVEYLESKEGRDVKDYLFVVLQGPTAGRAMRPDSATKLFARLSGEVGEKIHPHMLRHGFAVEKLEGGWQEYEVSLYLRHARVSSTKVYEHFTNRMKEERLRPYLNIAGPEGDAACGR